MSSFLVAVGFFSQIVSGNFCCGHCAIENWGTQCLDREFEFELHIKLNDFGGQLYLKMIWQATS